MDSLKITEYSRHIDEITIALKDTHGEVPTYRIVESIEGNRYNYEGRSYEGDYDVAQSVLVLYVTQQHRGKRYKAWEKVPIVFKVSEVTKAVISHENKPVLVDVLIVEK